MRQQQNGIEILKQICDTKRKKIQEKGMSLGYTLPKERTLPLIKPALLNDKTKPFIIAEVKRKSPTRGHISTIAEPKTLAKTYIEQGANAISVLCEEGYFKGSLQDLYVIKESFPQACILRKDFILHKDEVMVSYLFGADIVLLIVALFVDDMESFCEIYNELLLYNLTPFIEIHTLHEWNLIKTLNLEKAIIGINTRNLKTFQINKMDAMKLRVQIPKHIPVIFESGIKSNYDSFMAGSSGFQGILCGSFLVEALDKDSNNLANVSGKNVLRNLIKAFNIGSKKQVFSNLLQRFYTKNQNTHNNKPLIKICGINNLDFLQESLLRADMLGFILTKKSVRYVDKAFLQEATRCYKSYISCRQQDFIPLRVGVVTHDCLDIGREYLECGFIDCLQLHDMPISFCLESPIFTYHTESGYEYSIEAFYNLLDERILPFYPAINYKELLNVNEPLQTHFCLWDSSGGSGENLDIAKIQAFIANYDMLQGNLWLAGGISIDNLHTILTLKPMLLDICSGFESSRGEKSISIMREFFTRLDTL